MNKITKPILVSALSALAFGTVGVAGTFALFTDNGETQISAKAGIVSVKAAIGNLKTYSAKAASGSSVTGDSVTDEFGGKYNIVDTAVNGTFTNGGTASIDTQTGYLSLDRITPGDRVSFVVTPSTSSNVDVMYRVSYKVVNDSTHNLELAKGLTTRIGANQNQESFEGLEEYRSGWTYAQAVTASTSLTGIPFEIELPITAGNEYQGKSATIAVTVEGVQGNAAIQDGKYAKAIDKAIETTVSEGTEATELEATNATQTATVKTTIPANTQQVHAGDSVTLVVSDVETKEKTSDPTYTDLEFDASLYVNNVKVTEFSKDIDVEVQLATGLVISGVKHNGEPVTNYAYNSETGKLTFSTTSFSPFVVTYKAYYGFYDSYIENGHWVHEIKTKAHFKNIMDHIQARGGLSAKGYPLADKTSVYKILNDIDFGGSLWTGAGVEESVFQAIFTGKLTADEQVTLSNIHATTERKGTKGKSDDFVVTVLFDSINDATFENITLEDMTINGSSSCYSGFFATGNKNSSLTGDIAFKHCIVETDCSINVFQNGCPFLPLARYYHSVSFNQCVNKADVSATEYGATGFIGNSTAGTVAFSFVDCANYGKMTAAYLAGGYTGYATNGTNSAYMRNCYNYGDIYVTNSNGYHGCFFLNTNINSGWYTSIDAQNLYNYGKMYVNSSDGTVNSTYFGNNQEYSHYGTGAGEYQIINGNTGLTVAKADYFSTFVEVSNVGELTLSFDDTADYVLKSTAFANVDHVTVTLALHALRMSKETGLESPYIMGGESAYTISKNYASLEAIDIKRVSQIGYYVPDGAEEPSSSINYIFDRYLLDANSADPTDPFYANGYHERANGKSYIVLTNDVSGPEYLAVCVWRNRVNYTVTAYDSSNNVIARGSTQYGWDAASSGYDSLLTAITTD